jgi:hypothetical protein
MQIQNDNAAAPVAANGEGMSCDGRTMVAAQGELRGQGQVVDKDAARIGDLYRWRDVLPIHPAAELFPLIFEAELHEQADDIKQNGLQAPIVPTDDPGACDVLFDQVEGCLARIRADAKRKASKVALQ